MEKPRSKKPTYAQLATENADLRALVSEQAQQIAELVKDRPVQTRQIAALRAQIASLQAQVTQLATELKTARDEAEQNKRSAHRQAAPFSKGTRKPNPKRPGRKPGEGPFRCRQAPAGDHPVVKVMVEETACPHCGGELEPAGTELTSTTDLPVLPQVQVASFELQLCRCTKCGREVRARHHEVAVDQTGATAHRIGRRLMACSHLLRLMGIPTRKVPKVMKLMCGVELSQSAIIRDAQRLMGHGLGRAYQKLRDAIRGSPMVNTDDTGWRIGGKPAYLMVFESLQETVYQIREQHRNEEVREIIPSDFAGCLVCDRGPSYDAKELRNIRQQKCLAHLLRNTLEAMEKKKPGRALEFLDEMFHTLGAMIDLYHEWHDGERRGYEDSREGLVRQLGELLQENTFRDRDVRRLVKGLRPYHERGDLTRFLFDPSLVPPTNNSGERALRGPLIARKVSHCSKTVKGAEAYAALASVIRTVERRHPKNVLQAFIETLETGVVPAAGTIPA